MLPSSASPGSAWKGKRGFWCICSVTSQQLCWFSPAAMDLSGSQPTTGEAAGKSPTDFRGCPTPRSRVRQKLNADPSKFVPRRAAGPSSGTSNYRYYCHYRTWMNAPECRWTEIYIYQKCYHAGRTCSELETNKKKKDGSRCCSAPLAAPQLLTSYRIHSKIWISFKWNVKICPKNEFTYCSRQIKTLSWTAETGKAAKGMLAS